MNEIDLARMAHMLDAAEQAIQFVRGKTLDDLIQDRMLEMALTRAVSIVGEAAWRVSVETRDQFPSIPWQHAAGIRHRLVHDYDSVDLEILLDTVLLDFPALVKDLRTALADRA